MEALVSSVIILGVALSTAPMFTRALASNETGRHATEIANAARAHLEHLMELPFSSPELVLTGGSEKVTEDYYSTLTKTWHPGPPPVGTAAVLWERTTTVRQYSLTALADGVLDLGDALPYDAPAATVHMKEIALAIEQTGAVWGPAKRIDVRTLKVK